MSEQRSNLPTSYMSFKLKAANFFGVVMPFASSFGMMPSSPRPVNQLSIYFIRARNVGRTRVSLSRPTSLLWRSKSGRCNQIPLYLFKICKQTLKDHLCEVLLSLFISYPISQQTACTEAQKQFEWLSYTLCNNHTIHSFSQRV